MDWLWDKEDCIGLARFVIFAKNSEAVQQFIKEAVEASYLPASDYDFNQTQEDRHQLVEKIYNALSKKKVEYALNEYRQLSEDGKQLIRTPEKIFDTPGKGNCLDLAILFCAICWHYDLLPILILLRGHVVAAVSLTHCLRDWANEERRGLELFWEGGGILRKSSELQEMVDRRDYLAIECTGFAKSETLSENKFQRVDGFLSFDDQAVNFGRQQLDRPLEFALDIAIAYNFWFPNVFGKRLKEKEPKRFINSPLWNEGLWNEENPLLQLYVPLGLIERKPDAQRRPREDFSTPEESPFNKPDKKYEVVREYKNDEFFNEVLKAKNSKRSKGKRLVIVGDPGGGKTTLLQRIAYWILEEKHGFPIWIPLAEINNKRVQEGDETGQGWLYRYLLETWLRDIAENPKDTPKEWQLLFEELLASSQLWLLLDGADEMAVSSPLSKIKKQLVQGWANCVRVVLSCRLNLWEVEKEAIYENFDIYRTLDFQYPDQVHEFINKWFGKDDPKTKELLDKLGEDNRKRLRDLVKNPLRLALLCRIWREGLGTLPDTKAGFYQLLVENHYTWKDDTNEVFEISPELKKQLNINLGKLAIKAIDKEDSRFRLRESFIRNILNYPNEKSTLFWWALKLGWLINIGYPAEGERNPGEKVYAFFHPTFQEYFAALTVENWEYFLKNVPENLEQGVYRILELQWKEVILLWLGREDIAYENKENFIKALVDFNDGCGEWSNIDSVHRGFYEFQAYFLAAQGITEFNDCSLRNEIVPQIVRYSNLQTQLQWKGFLNIIGDEALNILLTINTTKTIEELIALICHPKVSSNTRRQAASSLGKIDPGNQTAIKGLIALICDQKEDFDTRRQAASSLEEIGVGNQTAIEGLIVFIRDQKGDSYIRREAISSLEKIGVGNQIVIEELIALIRDQKEDFDTRRQAASSLGKIDPGNQTAIEGLITFIRDQKEDFYTRRQAISSLEEIGVGNQTAIEELIALIRDQKGDSYIRREAASSLGKIGVGNQTVIEELIALIRDQKVGSYTRRPAASSLGEIDPGNQTAIEELIALIRDQNVYPDTRREATFSLGEIGVGNQTAIKELIALIHDQKGDFFILNHAAISLGKIGVGNQTAIEELIALIRDPKVDSDIRQPAAFSLGKIDPGNQTAIEGLIAVIRDPKVSYLGFYSYTGSSAVSNLGEIGVGNQTAIEELIALIRDPNVDPGTLQHVASSLGKIGVGNQTAIEELIAFIRDQKVFSNNLQWAAFSLKNIVLEKHMADVVSLLKNWLSYENYKNHFDLFAMYYPIIWNCAKKMTYPKFYEAWFKSIS